MRKTRCLPTPQRYVSHSNSEATGKSVSWRFCTPLYGQILDRIFSDFQSIHPLENSEKWAYQKGLREPQVYYKAFQMGNSFVKPSSTNSSHVKRRPSQNELTNVETNENLK